MIAEKDASNSTASNVRMICGSDSEGDCRDVCHKIDVGIGVGGEALLPRPTRALPPSLLSVAARFCSTALAAVPHFLYLLTTTPRITSWKPPLSSSCTATVFSVCHPTNPPGPRHTYKLSLASSYCHYFQCDSLQCSCVELAHLTEFRSSR